MANISQWTIKYISRYALIAFFLMSSIFLVIGPIDLYYYNITLATMNSLIYQLLTFSILIALFLLFHKKLLIINIDILFSLFISIFILIFMIKAPAFSLLVGGLLIIIPFIVFTLKSLIHDKPNKVNQYLLLLNVIIFLTILIFFLTRVGYEFPVYIGENISLINHESIIPTEETKFIIFSLILPITFLVFLIFFDHKKENKNLSKVYLSLGIVLVILEVVALSIIMIYRTKIFGNSTYDFGIFAQMFYNMKNFNGMVTTLERSVLLSHNAVHVSPIYYLMLPVFMIFPYIETLQVLQVIVVAIGVIPLYLIGKHFKLNQKVILLIVSAYIFHPAIISSSFYDLHENCFLAPLLLFVLYFGLKQKWVFLIISFLLTLMIKEDASIYLVFIGLYFLFSHSNTLDESEKRNNMIMSISMITISIIYFFIITSILNAEGDGAQFWRFNNLNAYNDLGLIGIPISLFQAPSYWLATMFTPNKIYHFLIIFSVIGFIPLYNIKLSRYWLIIPLLLLNFSSTYRFQHQFGFQYYYGTITLLIFMMILVFKDKSNINVNKDYKITSTISHGLIIIGLVLIGYFTLSTKMYYIEYYNQSFEMYDSMKNTLINVPRDKKVLATGYLTPYLSDREVLFDYNFYNFNTNDIEFDYIIVDKRMTEDQLTQIRINLIFKGYKESDISTDYILIFEPN